MAEIEWSENYNPIFSIAKLGHVLLFPAIYYFNSIFTRKGSKTSRITQNSDTRKNFCQTGKEPCMALSPLKLHWYWPLLFYRGTWPLQARISFTEYVNNSHCVSVNANLGTAPTIYTNTLFYTTALLVLKSQLSCLHFFLR